MRIVRTPTATSGNLHMHATWLGYWYPAYAVLPNVFIRTRKIGRALLIQGANTSPTMLPTSPESWGAIPLAAPPARAISTKSPWQRQLNLGWSSVLLSSRMAIPTLDFTLNYKSVIGDERCSTAVAHSKRWSINSAMLRMTMAKTA